MPKDSCNKALDREIALNALHVNISDSMSLLKKTQKEFTGMSEALWPLVFTAVLGEVRSIRHIQDNPWPSINASDSISASDIAEVAEELRNPDE